MGVLARKGDCNMNKLFFFDIDGTLKSVAKYITTNIEEEGITAACKHFNYIKD